MDDNLPTRETLLISIRDAQNAAAWEEFTGLYLPLIRRYCTLRGVDRQDIDDVAQEVLTTISSAMRKFEYDSKKGTFRDWLFVVTRSRVFDHFKKKQKHPQGTGRTTILRMLEARPDPKEQIDWDLDYRKQMFHWASEKVRPEFAPKTWDAFWQTAVDQKTAREVANSLGLSLGAVYVAKSRVIARLRDRIASVTGDMDAPATLQ